MKTYGIFTAYSPNTDFVHHGLGRYLATFVKAGISGKDYRFVIACPSWSRRSLSELFATFDIPEGNYEFLGPTRLPILLGLHDMVYRKPRPPKRDGRLRNAMKVVLGTVRAHFGEAVAALLSSRNIYEFAWLTLYLLAVGIVATPIALVAFLVHRTARPIRRHLRPAMGRLRRGVGRLLGGFSTDRRLWASRMYRALLKREMAAMIDDANRRDDIAAWYCPTAFWPDVHRLKAVRLICVPDVVLSEFPVAFARAGAFLQLGFDDIARTMSQPDHFVTYSDHIKWSVAVDRFGVEPQRVSVVNHAANDLSAHLVVSGFPDVEATRASHTQGLLASAIHRNRGQYHQLSNRIDFPFIFYASQFRPSKNVLTLLRAYEYLLRKRHFQRKLLLTGDPGAAPEVAQFVRARSLGNDVVFLPGLSEAQLAAAYALADLAVNPSLSEGGMPFTFTEALSVGTPVVMSDIAVTREVLTDPAVAAATLFDPYDWQAMADKISSALANRETLYARQRQFYDQVLAQRGWDQVVQEHIIILDRIATQLAGTSLE